MGLNAEVRWGWWLPIIIANKPRVGLNAEVRWGWWLPIIITNKPRVGLNAEVRWDWLLTNSIRLIIPINLKRIG